MADGLVPIDQYRAKIAAIAGGGKPVSSGGLVPIEHWKKGSGQSSADLAAARPGDPYSPALAQKYEGGGLQQPLVDPIDLATFALSGGTSAAGEAALREGTGLLGKEALAAGGREALRTGLSFPAMAIGGKAIQPAAQALEQMGPAGQVTGGLLEQAGSIAPIVGMEAGPAAAKGLYRGVAGAGDIEQTVRSAAEKAEAQGRTAREKLETAAEKESSAQRQAAGEAATQTGGAAQAAKDKLDQTRQQASAETAKKMATFREKARQDALKEARGETIQRELGRTQEETTRAVTAAPEVVTGEEGPAALPGQEITQRRSRFYNAVYGPKNRAADELGNKFDKFFAPHADKQIAVAPIQKAVADEELYAQANGVTYSPATQRILADLKAIGAPETGGEAFKPSEHGYTPKKWAQLNPDAREAIMKMHRGLVPATATREEMEAARQASQATGQLVSPVRELLGKRSQIGSLLSTAGGADRAALVNARDAIDDTLGNSGIPGAQQLRAQYRGFKTDFGKDFYRAIGKASDPSDAGAALFTNPQRMLQLASGANPEEKAVMRETFADWFNRPGNGEKVINREQAPALAAMGFKGALAKPEGWIYADKAQANLSEVLENAPQARQKYVDAINKAQADLRAELHQQIVKDALNETKKLGPAGGRIRVAIQAGKTPEQQANAAMKAFSELDPQAAQQEAAQVAAKSAPRHARMTLGRFQPPSPQEAGVKAVMGYTPGGNNIWNRMKYYGQRYAILGVPMALTGRAYFLETAGITGVTVGIRESIAKAFRYSIQKSPEAAAEFVRATLNPGAKGSLDTIARSIVESSLPAETAQIGHAAPRSKGPGPMSSAIEQRKAEKIAGTRTSPERLAIVEDLNRKIASGDQPDVQDNLKNGRLSTTEVRKMLDQNEGHNIASALDGLTVHDSIEMLAKANPQEKELYFPAVIQKIQNESGKLPMEQRQSILAQLSNAMQSEKEQAVG